MALLMWSAPASILGQSIIVCICSLRKRGENFLDLLLFAAVGSGGRVKDHQQERLLEIDFGAAAGAVDDFEVMRGHERAGDVAAGAADAQDRVGSFAHAHQIVGRALGAREMIMRELGDGVAGAFVDRAGNFAALDVNDADIHVGGGKSGSESLVAVADEHHDVGLQPLKFAGKFHYGEAERFGHRGGR